MKRYSLNEMLISSNLTIKEAMLRLDKVASKILFLIDDNKKFIGSLTDGDIRRGLLSSLTLDSEVVLACNRNSYRLKDNYDRDRVYQQMKELDIVFAPVLNDNKEVVSILTIPDSHKEVIKKSNTKLDIPLVIMAGGKGTRMAPFTSILPKPLIPIGEKTILELIIEEFSIYGVNSFYFTLNYKGEIIKAYFDSIEKNYKLEFIWEKEFLGTAGCLTLLKDTIGSPFFVSNCDIIVKADIADVYKFHKENGAMLTLISSIQHHTIPYGVVEFANGGKVSVIKEKPVYSFPINTGVYLLEPECLDYIPENTEFHMTHLIEKLINEGKNVCTYPVNESEYIDIGQWDEYKNAINKMLV